MSPSFPSRALARAAAALAWATLVLSLTWPACCAAQSPAARRPARASRPPDGARFHEKGPALDGVWSIVREGGEVRILRISPDSYRLEARDWQGVGMIDSTTYVGVFTRPGVAPGRRLGLHRIEVGASELLVRITWLGAGNEPVEDATQVWRRAPADTMVPDRIVVAPPSADEAPKFGEYVYVEELPEAITRVAPSYPAEARHAGVEGTVMIQALVAKDGTVADTRVVKSIPLLDLAAVDCVRQWRFKPALSKGEPVALWVAVPVRFALH